MVDHGEKNESTAHNEKHFQQPGDDSGYVMDHAGDILYRFNFLTNQYDYISGNVEQITGFTSQEIMETGVDHLLESLHPDDKSKFMKIYNGLINSTIDTSDMQLEYRTQHKDGHYVHRSDNLKIIRNENSQIIAVVGAARDIANLQQTEQQLLNSEQRYKQLAEATFEGIAIHDKGVILDVNRQYCDMFGYEPDEIIGVDGITFTTPESEAIIREHVANGFEGPYKVVCKRKDGSAFPVEIRARSVFWGDKPARIATFRDLTETVKLQQELADSQDHYKRLAEASFEAIAIHDQGRIIDVNQQYLDMFGYTLEEKKHISGLDTIAPQSRDTVIQLITEKYEGTYEAFGVKKDGTIFPIEIHAKESLLDGRPIRIVAIRDLTAEKHNQQKLAESEKKYRELYENANVALFRTALDGTLLECNRATWDFFGHPYEKEDVIPEKYLVSEAYVDPTRRNAFVQTLQKKGYVKYFEAQLRRADGNLFWAAISATLNPEQGCIEGALYDITIKKVLTKTEKDILTQLMEGKTNKEIAFQTGRSIRTIEDHRAHIMQKLGVDNLVDLTKKAMSFDPPSQ